jgi:hypothetical protein
MPHLAWSLVFGVMLGTFSNMFAITVSQVLVSEQLATIEKHLFEDRDEATLFNNLDELAELLSSGQRRLILRGFSNQSLEGFAMHRHPMAVNEMEAVLFPPNDSRFGHSTVRKLRDAFGRRPPLSTPTLQALSDRLGCADCGEELIGLMHYSDAVRLLDLGCHLRITTLPQIPRTTYHWVLPIIVHTTTFTPFLPNESKGAGHPPLVPLPHSGSHPLHRLPGVPVPHEATEERATAPGRLSLKELWRAAE